MIGQGWGGTWLFKVNWFQVHGQGQRRMDIRGRSLGGHHTMWKDFDSNW
jgi:hypothetical protein